MRTLLLPVLFLGIVAIATGVNLDHLQSRKRLDINKGVIVHLFEWKWEDIALECEEFLSKNGFAGVQISPPMENLKVVTQNRPWWERYQPVSYKLITRSGTEAQLANMVQRCNKVGVRIFADAVFNHMTGDWPTCVGTGGSTCDMANLNYPAVPYTRENFHYPECDINNYNNATDVRTCKLVGLHDLDQGQEHVRDMIVNYLNSLIDHGVAGFRIDAAKHQDPAFLGAIFSRLHDLNTDQGFAPNTKALVYQEVMDMTGYEAVKYQEYTQWGLVTDFRFGNELGRCFQRNNQLHWLRNFGLEWNLLPGDQSIVYIENHDTERSGGSNILTYKTPQNYKMAVGFALAWGYGQPKVTSSFAFTNVDAPPPQDSNFNLLSPRPITNNQCSNGFVCQHRWREVSSMVYFNKVVQGAPTNYSWWDNGDYQIAFGRKGKGFVAFNLESYELNSNLQTGLPAGTYCDVISGELQNNQCTGKSITVGSNGYAQIQIDGFNSGSSVNGFVAYHIEAKTLDMKLEEDFLDDEAKQWFL